MKFNLIAFALLAFAVTPACAQLGGCSDQVTRPCELFGPSIGKFSQRVTSKRLPIRGWSTPPQKKPNGSIRRMRAALASVLAEGAGRIVDHPMGCPRRAFCGCGAAVRVFGRPVRALWQAASWFKFPRTSPAPGTVAVRRHHVFVLEQHIGGSTWMVYDANSGGRATRIHPRSIAGYIIVNPHG